MVWFVAGSLWIYPHSLSYFNELVGGPTRGPRHLLGSNVDWGQDLRYLGWFLDELQARGEQRRLLLAYSGMYDPADADCRFPKASSVESLENADLRGAMLAISVNTLFGGSGPTRGGMLVGERLLERLRARPPRAMAGYSIWIYDQDDIVELTSEEP